MTKQLRSLMIAGSALLVFAGLGQAAAFQLRDAAGGDGVYLAGAVRTGVGSVNAYSGRAGTFDLELNTDGPTGDYFSLLTYGVDPTRNLVVGPVGGVGGAFNISTLVMFFNGDPATVEAVEKLWANAVNDSMSSATKAAAFQFLIWEYMLDSSFDLTQGNVSVMDADVLAQANAWTTASANWSRRGPLLVIDGRGEDKQSFLYAPFVMDTMERRMLNPVMGVEQEEATPTPEPGTYVLLSAGLIGLAALYSRRPTEKMAKA